jgi:hypothetical protein
MTAEVDAIFFGVMIIAILNFTSGGLAGWVERLYSPRSKPVGRASDG